VYDNPRSTWNITDLPQNIFYDQGLQTQVPRNQKSPTDFSMRDNG
jgi:D-lyxose ketol-isomerase